MPEWYSSFADAVGNDGRLYLECESCGTPTVPPRTICPACGESSLVERPLSKTATVVSFTEIHVTIPKFHGTTPYTVVVAAFDEGLQLTGQLRGRSEEVAIGDAVVLGNEVLDDGSNVLVFELDPTEQR